MRSIATIVLLSFVGLAGCRPREKELVDAPSASAMRARLRGMGATFPDPLYTKWAFSYFQQTGIRVAYEQAGSQAGIDALLAGRCDFAASDIPLDAATLEQAGLIQFPLTIGAVVPIGHLPGVDPGEMSLSPATLAGIYLGDITLWDDAAIAADNPELTLPAEPIIPIYRADTSGTNHIFSDYMGLGSERWRNTIGVGAGLSWPVGVGAVGTDQAVRFVEQFKYTLAYVELSHANAAGARWITLKTPRGIVVPTHEAVAETIRDIEWNDAGAMTLPTQRRGWPLVGASYVVIPRRQSSFRKARQMLELFYWALTDGALIAEALGYEQVPAKHLAQIEAAWRAQVRAADRVVW